MHACVDVQIQEAALDALGVLVRDEPARLSALLQDTIGATASGSEAA